MSEAIRRERLAFKAEAERLPWSSFAMGGEDLRPWTVPGLDGCFTFARRRAYCEDCEFV
jgi:hypothetical protein